MSHYINSYPNRTLCEVIEEARKCHETRNYAYLLGLLEEIQHLANRMEGALHDQKDVKNARETISNAKEELKDIKAEIKALEKLRDTIKK